MIDAKELRIGNKVLKNGVFVCDVLSLRRNEIEISFEKEIYALEYKNVQPIALTEEILMRCGFEKVNSDSWEYVLKLPNYESFVIEYFEYTDAWYYTAGEGTRNGKGWKYLHELQNGLHAIYGEDLNVNL